MSPVKESEFSKSQLWPKSNHNWMAPGAVQSVQSKYGQDLDLGALKVIKGIWHILWSTTPTSSSPFESEWIPFEFSNDQHRTAANAFNRYGVGWSYVPVDPVPVQPSPVKPVNSLTLSNPDKRVQELLSLIPFRDMILPKFIIESLPRFILELILAKRRMEERIISRVIEGLKDVKKP